MGEQPDDKCGYTHPEDYEVGDDPIHQSCCYCDSVPDADRCVWHVEPDATDEKTIQALQNTRADAKVRNQTSPTGELLDGVVLAGIELHDSISFHQVALRNADLTDADLREADLTDADLRAADLTDAYLFDADLTDANLRKADLFGANVFQANFTSVDARDAEFKPSSPELMIPLGSKRSVECTPYFHSNQRFGVSPEALESGVLTSHDIEPIDDVPSPANLEDAVFENADLRGATLTDAQLYQTDLTNARINAETEFGDDPVETIYEQRDDLEGLC